MKSLRTLHKLGKRELETLRRALTGAQKRQADAEARIVDHDAMVVAERLLSTADFEATRALPAFSERAGARRDGIIAELQGIALEIEHIRGLITEAHVELRKFERLIELDEARERAAQEKREAAELDEFATIRNANR